MASVISSVTSLCQCFLFVPVCVQTELYELYLNLCLNERKLCRSVLLEHTALCFPAFLLHALWPFCDSPRFSSCIHAILSSPCAVIGLDILPFIIRCLFLSTLFHACKKVRWALNVFWLWLNSVWSDICEPLGPSTSHSLLLPPT